eukprot:10922781-Karenia_brevis.AAC.1
MPKPVLRAYLLASSNRDPSIYQMVPSGRSSGGRKIQAKEPSAGRLGTRTFKTSGPLVLRI